MDLVVVEPPAPVVEVPPVKRALSYAVGITVVPGDGRFPEEAPPAPPPACGGGGAVAVAGGGVIHRPQVPPGEVRRKIPLLEARHLVPWSLRTPRDTMGVAWMLSLRAPRK